MEPQQYTADDPSLAVLTSAGAQYRPLVTGYLPRRASGIDGLFRFGGPLGTLAPMFLSGPLERAAGSFGRLPMGVGHDQNVYDRLVRQRFSEMQARAVQAAAAADVSSFTQTFLQLLHLTGTPVGLAQRQQAETLAGLAANTLAPFLVHMAPEFYDRLGGVRGSAAVLAKRLIEAGRYRIDPVTGRLGLSAETAGFLARTLFADLYGADVLPQMHGLSAGQVGSLLQELQFRGMVPTAEAAARFVAGDVPGRAAVLRAVDDLRRTDETRLYRAAAAAQVDINRPQGLTAADIDKLRLDPAVADRLRTFDAERVKRTLYSYVDLVSAVRDIFGDLGRPNAPMAELVAAVEALTLNGMGQIAPARMADMVRQTYNLARQTGVPLSGVYAMQSHAANRAGMLGLEPIFAVHATQGALAFGGAYRAQGHAAYGGWGVMSADQLTQLDANLRLQAAASAVANRAAVAVRLAEAVGGFDPESEAGRFVAAVQARSHAYRAADGTTRTLAIGPDEFVRMLVGARTRAGRPVGVTAADVMNMIEQTAANRPYVERYGIMDPVRRLQGPAELHTFVGGRMADSLAASLTGRLQAAGLSEAEARQRAVTLAGKVGDAVARRLFALSTAEVRDPEQRERLAARFVAEEAGKYDPAAVELMKKAPGDLDDFLRVAASVAFGEVDRAIASSPAYRHLGNFQNVHSITNETVLAEADRGRLQAALAAELQKALAPLGRGSLLQRLVDAVRDLPPGDMRPIERIAAGVIGVKTSDVNKAVLPHVVEFNARRREVERLQEQVLAESDPQRRAELNAELTERRRELRERAEALAKLGESHGLFDDALSARDVDTASRHLWELLRTQDDLVGLRGNFGAEVSAEQLAAFRAGLTQPPDPRNPLTGPLTDADRAAVVRARKAYDYAAIHSFLTTGRGQLNQYQQQTLNRAYAAVRDFLAKHPDQAPLPPEAVRGMVLQQVESGVGAATPEELAAVTPESLAADDFAARAVVLHRRRGIPVRASDEAVEEVMRQRPDLLREEATVIADARVRASRLGLDQATVERHMAAVRAADPHAYSGPFGEVEAIADLFQQKIESLFTATKEEVEALDRSLAPEQRPTPDQLRKFRERFRPNDPAPDEAINHLMYVHMVVARKRQEAKERFAQFWAGPAGRMFRDQVAAAGESVDVVAGKLLSAASVRRYGTRALKAAEELRAGQQRLRELAVFHTGGDLARLLARDFAGLLEGEDPEKARRLVAALNAEITAIQRRQRAIVNEIALSEGLPGRQFERGDEVAARQEVLQEQVARRLMPQDEAQRILDWSRQNAFRFARIDAVRQQVGSEAAAAAFLGLDPDAPLDDLQRAAVAAVRFGLGSVAHARAVYGEAAWDRLPAAEQEEKLRLMQKGTGGDVKAALALLGVSPEEYAKAGPLSGLAQRVKAVATGLSTDSHLKEAILTPLPARQDGESDAAYAARLAEHAGQRVVRRDGETDAAYIERARQDYEKFYRWVRYGFYHPAVAKEQLSVTDDPMPADLAEAVDRARERAGAEAEARRLLEHSLGRPLTADKKDRELLADKTAEVLAAARLSYADEEFLAAYEAKSRFLEQMAESRGLKTKDLRSAGDRLVLTPEESARLSRLADLDSRLARARAVVADLERSGPSQALDAAKKELARLQAERDEVERELETDAEVRGVSVADYLAGKGWIDAGSLQTFRVADKAFQAMEPAAEALAKRIGVSVERLPAVLKTLRDAEGARLKAQAKDAVSAVDLTRDVLRAYGFSVGEQPGEFETGFAAKVVGGVRQAMLRRVLETQQELIKVAGSKDGRPPAATSLGDVDAMAKEYFAAAGDPAKLREFRQKYGLWEADPDRAGGATPASDAAFERFRSALDFQQQAGLLKVGAVRSPYRTLNQPQDVERLFMRLVGDVGRDRPEAAGPAGGWPARIEMSGTVTLRGDRLDMSGAWGAGRDYVQPAP